MSNTTFIVEKRIRDAIERMFRMKPPETQKLLSFYCQNARKFKKCSSMSISSNSVSKIWLGAGKKENIGENLQR